MKTKKQITKELLGVLEDFELIPEHVLVEDEVKRILDRMRDKKEMDMFNDPTWNWSGLQ
jgi:DNA-directed RNA polymerase subunit H (RpoH/RPB5)|tara:strand:- start:917 stop:1093 length:177 start_codon:yes stop_codon:yes gene_type:complete